MLQTIKEVIERNPGKSLKNTFNSSLGEQRIQTLACCPPLLSLSSILTNTNILVMYQVTFTCFCLWIPSHSGNYCISYVVIT